MAFGDKIKKWGDQSFGDKMKDLGRVLDPLGANVLFGSRSKLPKPDPVHYGGSEEAAEAARQRFTSGAESGGRQMNAAVRRGNSAADEASKSLDKREWKAANLGASAESNARGAGAGFSDSMRRFTDGRDATLDNAAALERSAGTMASEYQQTADKAFAANQDRNQRSALSLAAGRGASGLRTALASSSAANSDAAAQAEITRANQTNQMIGMANDARVQAAGIRSGVGTQDQNAAGVYSGRQAQFDQNALGANAQAGTHAQNAAQIQQNAANTQANAGVATQGQYLGALTSMETAKLSADQKNEEAKINAAMAQRNSKGLLGKIWG